VIVCREARSQSVSAISEIHRTLEETLQVAVIIPTYNESENIKALVTQLLALPTVPGLVDKIGQGHDLAIGSRYVPGGGSSGCTIDRKLLSWGANAFARTMLGLRAHDTTAGFRCYRRQVLEAVDLDRIKASGYSFLIEMLYRVHRRGWRVGEVPIVFENRRLGTSKISKDEILRAMGTVLRLGWTRVTGKPA